MTLLRAWRALESLLRIHRLGSGWAVLQFRAIYTILIGFGFLQFLNLFITLPTYGGWSPYLLVSIFFVLIPIPLTLSLRWVDSRIPMTFLLGSLILFGIGMPAMPDNTGIDTSLLPYLAVGPAILSFTGGWRAGLLFFPAGLALLVALAENAGPGDPGLLTGMTSLQQLRFSQAAVALAVATCVSCALSAAAQASIIGIEKARSRADAAEASQSQFLAAMSHELRTPMNAVIGLTGVLLSDEDKNLTAKQRELLDTIDGAGRQLLAVVDDILNISKLDADMVAIDPEPFQLRKMLTSLVQTFSANAEAKQLQLSLEVLPEISEFVEGDDLRLRQIVSNLLSNAIKFTEAGSVSVRAGVLPGRPEWIWIEVQDTGCGIPLEKSDAVFNPFEQAESGSVRRHDGTGLGLAICRRLTELMGGEINLKNTGPDGTTFVVMLPLPPTHGAGLDQGADEENSDARLDGLEVLVVEDNMVNQLVIKEILKMLGASPRFAGNGIEALETLANCRVDVVLMDKHMPEMNGIETTQAIRSSGETWADIPIIAATADAMEGEEAAMLEAGMDGFVPKPVRSAELATTVRRVLAEVAAQPTDEAASGTT